MITISIIGLVGMGIIIGALFRNSQTSCDIHWDYDIKSGKLSSLETRVFVLEQDNQRLNFIINQHNGLQRMFKEQMYAHCYRCEKTFCSRDFKDKDIAESLNKITLSAEEIAKKLGMELK